MEGLRRDFPEYYNNIIRQINRCFRPPEGNWVTTLTFKIRRDGTVTDLQFVQRSGNTAYDYVAMEAVECAGQGRFGPLPEELPPEFPVQFEIRRTR
jgi:TonB family protein